MKLFNHVPADRFLGVLILTGGLALNAPAAETAQQILANGFSGRVVETLEAAGYTYIRVDTGNAKPWAAAPRLSVKAGDRVEVGKAMPMRNYHSKTLNRDFDVVYFTGNAKVNGEAPAASGSPAALPAGHPPITGHGSPTKAGPTPDFSNIKMAEGGKRISEIFADKAELKDKEVKVRGRVVKFNANIMGKNWIHIQDGTGKNGSNDLTITSASRASVGDLILVTGKVTTDRNFGGTYQYPILIEDAKITVE